jgi:2-oxoglutarate ferredoxin oxidoreductase subunit alpha
MQAPVFVLSDLDMGMNQWMSKPFQYPKTPMDRGKVLWEKDLEEIKGNWGRYLDKDGDGIPYRTLPGNKHAMSAYFTRGTGHDEYAKYTEDSVTFHRNMERLKKKYESAKGYLPKPVFHGTDGAEIGIIAYGSTEAAINEARDQLSQEHGMQTSFMRIRAFPFSKEVDEFVRDHDPIYVVEMNRDGQLHQLLSLANPAAATKLISVAYGDGLPASATWVRERILAKAGDHKPHESTGSAAKKSVSKNDGKGAK